MFASIKDKFSGIDVKSGLTGLRKHRIASYQMLSGAAAVTVLVVAVLMVAVLSSLWLVEGNRARSMSEAENLASRVDLLIRSQRQTIQSVAGSEALANAFAGKDDQAIKQWNELLSQLLPGALKVRLLYSDTNKTDESRPKLGYAALQLMKTSLQPGKAVIAEVHLMNTEHRHIALLSAVGKDDKVVGFIHVALPVGLLQQALQDSASSYLELQQSIPSKTLTLLSTPGVEKPLGKLEGTLAVSGSRWRVAYWPVGGVGTLITQWIIVGGILVLAVIAIFGLQLVISRRLRGNLRRDQGVIIKIVDDMLAGDVRSRYPIHLEDFRDTISLLLQRSIGLDDDLISGSSEPDAAEPADAGQQAGDMLDTGTHAKVKQVPASIFRAYDIRGIVGDKLTDDVVRDIGQAIGSEAYDRGQSSVIVARDGRLSGPELSQALCEGIQASGRDVIDLGMVPTPLLYFATHFLRTSSGVMLTGSHNPPDYNGLKIVLAGETLAGPDIQALRNRIETGEVFTGNGIRQEQALVPEYIGQINMDIHLSRPMKVVVDCGNGVAGIVAPALLRTLGCEVIELYCEVDGNFPNHHPDPSKPDNLEDLKAAVNSNGADIGLAFDGDGDRLGVVDAEGTIIYPDRLLMLFAKDVLSRNPGAEIIYDVKCSRELATAIVDAGGQPLMWKTGHSFIKGKMAETGALLAGEMSGHVFFKERWYGFDDGIYTAARLLEILSSDSRTPAEIFAELPELVSTPELNLGFAEGEHLEVMEELVKNAAFPDARIITLDGLRVEFGDGWGLVRASNTTPSLVFRFEASNENALAEIQARFRELLVATRPDLEVPF